MTDISKLCMVCLGEKNADGICPDCRKDTDVINPSPLLPVKSILAQRYIIAKARKVNCEGVTYSAFDMKTNKPCSIREFFPTALSKREADELSVAPSTETADEFIRYLNAFISLWSKLQRLKGLTALITVTEVFQHNNTAYAVYDESERITLRDYLLETKEGFITWEKARIIFMPVLSTLGTLHTSGIIHKGINPSSFIFSKEGKLKLTDFCILPARTPTGTLEPELFDGYAPLEQYSAEKAPTPASDIYSFCSVLYRALIGTTPIDAKSRAQHDQMMIPARFAEQLPPYVINALISGMAIEPEERTENIEQLRSDLSASPRVIGASAPAYTPSANPEPAKPAYIPPAAAPVREKSINSVAEAELSRQKAQLELENEKRNKKKNTLIGVLIGVLAVMSCIILGLFALLFFGGSGSQGENGTTDAVPQVGDTQIVVPNFKGAKIVDIITNTAYTENLNIITEEQASSTVMKGIVIGQNIAPDSIAPKGSSITLYVSKGPQSMPLPDVTDKTYEEAEKILTDAGLICVKSYVQNSEKALANKVESTVPEANQPVMPGDTVTVIIYTDPDEGNSEEATDGNSGGNSVEDFLENLQTTVPSF